MKRMAMVEGNLVKGIAAWDGIQEWNPGEQFVLIDVTEIPCNPDDIYNPDDGSFTAPDADDGEERSMIQDPAVQQKMDELVSKIAALETALDSKGVISIKDDLGEAAVDGAVSAADQVAQPVNP